MYVLKVGGNEIDQPEFLAGLSTVVRELRGPGIIVHGGGKEIATALARHQIPYHVVEGMRATSTEAMAIVEQILSGSVNKRLVALLNESGVPAIGLSGVDLHLLQTRPLRPQGHDVGRVGEIVAVRADVLRTLLAQGWLPVLSPVSVDRDDHAPTNVNADQAALAVAAALGAGELIFVSNVPGVLVRGVLVERMTPPLIERAIAEGLITGGMIPKVRAAAAALEGVRSVRITNLAGLVRGGTRLVRDEDQ